MPAQPRLSRAVIVVAALSLTAAAGLLFLLSGPLRGDAAMPAAAMTAGKPMEPVLPVLDEVRSALLPTVERCVVGSRDEEAPPSDPFRVRLELTIANAEARFAFERVEPQGGREFPVLGACLSERLAAQRFALRAVPPADYATDGVFVMPWVATVSAGD